MAFGDLKKIAINFTAAMIVAMIFSSVAPGAAEKAYAFFEDKLGFGAPSIGHFSVAVDENDNSQFVVKYGILGDYRDVEQIIVSRSYGKVLDASKAADAKMSDGFKLLCSLNDYTAQKCDILTLEGTTVVNDYLKKGEGLIEGAVKIGDSKNSISVAGVHRFTIEVFLSNGDADSADAQVMVYDDDYVQLFNGGLQGWCERRTMRNADPATLNKCDVDAEKREAFEALSSSSTDMAVIGAAVTKALEMAKGDGRVGSGCNYESSGGICLLGGCVGANHKLTDDCTPEEVDEVWKEYLKIRLSQPQYSAYGDYKISYDCGVPLKYYYDVCVDNNAYLPPHLQKNCEMPSGDNYGCAEKLYGDRVCKVKRQVVATLDKLGWTDLREKRGWEACV